MKKLTSVFMISVVIAFAFVLWGAIAPGNLNAVTTEIQGFISTQLGWFYLLAASGFLVFALFLIFSPYGRIKLGKPDDQPEYGYLTWFAFLFTAGMGIGLVFWGAAEPLYHYYAPPSGDGETTQAANDAMQYSFFHWGLHPWAFYAVVALALAYFKFRHDAPGVVSATFRPLIGDKVDSGWGSLINILVVFATIFGVATSLGLGTAQVGAGLDHIFGFITNDIGTQLLIILAITIMYMISSLTGLNRGIKYLSRANIILALGLMAFVLIVGPTVTIMSAFTTTLGSYLQNLPAMSFNLEPFGAEGTSAWIEDWTIFYWAWWLSWAPYVGTFIARVSRGRTIREFVIGVLAVPTIFGTLWFATFGGSAIHFDGVYGGALYDTMVDEGGGEEVALYSLLDVLPLSEIVSVIAVLLIISFFVTSADSATFVLGMQTTNGSLNPPVSVKFIWGIIQSSAAAVLLYSGGLGALQTAAIISALPFTIIMIFMIISVIKSLRQERPNIHAERTKLREERGRLKEEKERLKREKAQFKKEQAQLRTTRKNQRQPKQNESQDGSDAPSEDDSKSEDESSSSDHDPK
ncbi:glycine betaine transporter [Salsuginibacillus halophilus]|uniref:Glycine betaine transporter n=1 Tax=Salsuginibacillus halophilus TaxID=517424 RepID=A0A2P8HXC0_9BACI|nr:BCCT family transporter [Salsuginibacillus halophilus]PSL50848.1 glycine betaine transporter [Salsuginibacillus halophilus]